MLNHDGRTVLVTGANGGLGFLTSLRFARHGVQVIMAVRDVVKGRSARQRIHAASVRGPVELRQLDLADIDAVRSFDTKLAREPSRLGVWINNVGIMMPTRALRAQDHELQFAVNHLAHFMLTNLLLVKLGSNVNGRVVTVSSDLHKRELIHFDDLAGQRQFGRIAFYAQSKFANVVFALELASRLVNSSSPVKSVLADPGIAATKLQLSAPSGILKLFMRIANRFLAQPAEAGVLPQRFGATSPWVRSGDFVGPDGPGQRVGHPTWGRPAKRAEDPALAKRLWAFSAALTDVGSDMAVPVA